MAELYSGKLRFLESERLRLIAATRDLIARDLEGRQQLAEVLGAEVPPNWPPELYDNKALDYAANLLSERSEQFWSFWYVLEKTSDPMMLVGICGFKGRPDPDGMVEIGYSVLNQYRNEGYATEATSRLTSWAFSHPGVRQVTAETLPHLRQSIRVLEKSGFSYVGSGSERGVIRYAMRRSDLD